MKLELSDRRGSYPGLYLGIQMRKECHRIGAGLAHRRIGPDSVYFMIVRRIVVVMVLRAAHFERPMTRHAPFCAVWGNVLRLRVCVVVDVRAEMNNERTFLERNVYLRAQAQPEHDRDTPDAVKMTH